MGIGQYDLLKNVQPAETTNLNVLNVNTINTLKDAKSEGEVVDYSFVCTSTKAQINEFIQGAIDTYNLPPAANATTSGGDVDVYKLVYLARDARAADNLVEMSATLLVPKKITKTYIESYKHGALFFYNDQPILRNGLLAYSEGRIDLDTALSVVGNGLGALAVGEVITVQADLVSWGSSSGRSAGVDKEANVYSEVASIIATRNLILRNPDNIFDQFIAIKDPSEKIDVVLEGYSLGAISGPSRGAYIMENSDKFNLNVKIVLSEGMVSGGINTLTQAWAGAYNPVISPDYVNSMKYILLTYTALILGSSSNIITTETGMNLTKFFRPNIIVDVIQGNNSLYTKDIVPPDEITEVSFTIPRAVIQSVLNNLLYEPGHDDDPDYLINPFLTLNISTFQLEAYSETGIIPETVAQIAVTFINPLYLFSEEYQVNGAQLFGNGCDYTSKTAVPVEYLKGVPFVEIHVSSDEIFNALGVKSSVTGPPPYNVLTQFTQLPDISPYYMKSFVTGAPIDNKYFSYFSKYVADPANPGFFIPSVSSSQWKVNSNTDPNNGLNVSPVSMKRNSSLYEEYLAQDATNVSFIVDEILSVVGTEKCKEFQCAPPPGYNYAVNGQTSYGSHVGFAFYCNICISYNFLKNLN